jgi:hypothetical protein
VHDLVADINRPAVAVDGALDDLDGAIDAGAESAWAGEQDRERLLGLGHEDRSERIPSGWSPARLQACGPLPRLRPQLIGNNGFGAAP